MAKAKAPTSQKNQICIRDRHVAEHVLGMLGQGPPHAPSPSSRLVAQMPSRTAAAVYKRQVERVEVVGDGDGHCGLRSWRA